jgi:hypothetical protein
MTATTILMMVEVIPELWKLIGFDMTKILICLQKTSVFSNAGTGRLKLMRSEMMETCSTMMDATLIELKKLDLSVLEGL